MLDIPNQVPKRHKKQKESGFPNPGKATKSPSFLHRGSRKRLETLIEKYRVVLLEKMTLKYPRSKVEVKIPNTSNLLPPCVCFILSSWRNLQDFLIVREGLKKTKEKRTLFSLTSYLLV
ncbi:hypothetical protein L1887_23734 [Cichorium endivia]|nr:hypothetical protein L1887_23734 [Cichorium endivia]